MNRKLYSKLLMLLLALAYVSVGWSQTPGTALQFNGTNNYVVIPHSTSLNVTANQSITVSSWVKMPATISGTTTYFSKQRVYSLDLNGSYSQFRFNCTGKSSYNFYSVYTFTPNQWYYIVVTFNGTNVAKLYVDGNFIANGAMQTTANTGFNTGTPSFPCHIGARTSSTLTASLGMAEFWGGMVDEVRLYNAVLSATDIQAGMFTQPTGTESGLVAYYDCNTGTGTVVSDATANINSGIFSGTYDAAPRPTWTTSYAFVRPTATTATAISTSGFTANWLAPTNATVTSYLVDVAPTIDFATATTTTMSITGTSATITANPYLNNYYYRVRGVGDAGITTNSNVITIDLINPSVSNGTIKTTAYTASVPITPNESGTVYYSLTANTVASLLSSGTSISVTANTSSTVSFSNLTLRATYTVYYVTKDLSGNVSTMGSATFTTNDDIPPVLTVGKSASPNSIGLTLSTDENAKLYYLTTESTQATITTSGIQINTTAGTATTINFTSLATATIYSFYIVGIDEVGNVSSVTPIFVSTLPITLTSSTGALTQYTASILVSTNVKGKIYYSKTDNTVAGLLVSSSVDALSGVTTTISLTGLTPSSTCTLYTVSKDEVGNVSSVCVLTFNVPAPDLTAPVITLGTVSSAKTSASLPVTLNESGKVYYSITASTQATLTNVSTFVTANTAATVSLPNLTANTIYTLNMVAVDLYGNISNVSSVTFATLSQFGTALQFNGTSSYVQIVDNGSLKTTSHTVSAWIKIPTTFTTTQQAFFSKRDTYMMGLLNATTFFYSRIEHGSAITFSYPFVANEWYNVALSFDGDKVVTFYVNGVLVGSDSSTTGISQYNDKAAGTGYDYYIGARNGWGTVKEFFAGAIDEVRLYNNVLSASDIQATMFTQPTGTEANLKGYWNFNEASGTTLTDLTANANSGTLVNSPVWASSYAQVRPTIAAATNVTTTSFTANWTAPSNADITSYLLDVATTTDFTNPIATNVSVTTNTYNVTGVTTNTTVYYYRVRAVGNAGISTNSLVASADLIVPNISISNPSSITNTGANFTITVNKTGTVYYSLTQPVSTTGTGLSVTTSATISLSSLTAGTNYTLYAVLKDVSGNISSVASKTFTTAIGDVVAPIITIGTTSASASLASIRLSVSENARVYYSLTQSSATALLSSTNIDILANVSTPIILRDLLPSHEYTFYVIAEDEAGNLSTVSSKTFTTLQSEVNQNIATQLKVYPNPASEKLNVSYVLTENDKVDIQLYTTTGVEVKAIALGNQNSGNQLIAIDVTNLSDGVYILKLQTKSGLTSIPVIIKR